MGRIVVGVDGSDNAQRALEWAAREAVVHGSTLEVVHVYEHRLAWLAYADDSMSASYIEAVRQDMEAAQEEARRHAQQVADDMVARLDGIEGLDGVEVTTTVIDSHRPSETLVERSADADLLVIGSRGRGGFTGLLLGSVSQQCATHATCPVVIIRPES